MSEAINVFDTVTDRLARFAYLEGGDTLCPELVEAIEIRKNIIASKGRGSGHVEFRSYYEQDEHSGSFIGLDYLLHMGTEQMIERFPDVVMEFGDVDEDDLGETDEEGQKTKLSLEDCTSFDVCPHDRTILISHVASYFVGGRIVFEAPIIGGKPRLLEDPHEGLELDITPGSDGLAIAEMVEPGNLITQLQPTADEFSSIMQGFEVEKDKAAATLERILSIMERFRI